MFDGLSVFDARGGNCHFQASSESESHEMQKLRGGGGEEGQDSLPVSLEVITCRCSSNEVNPPEW